MSRERVFDCAIYSGQTLPQQRKRLADGKVIRVSRPRTAGNPWRADRCVTYLDAAGHVKDVPLSDGAGLVDADRNGHKAAKLRSFGWYPYAECPIALVNSGALRSEFISEELLSEPACQRGTYGSGNPCAHTKREEDIRKARSTAEDKRRRAMYQSEADKTIVSSHERQAALLEKQSEVLGKAVEAITAQVSRPTTQGQPKK